MKLIWLKLFVIIVLLGGSWVFYSFGSKEISFEVPSAVSFEEVKERIATVAEEAKISKEEAEVSEAVARFEEETQTLAAEEPQVVSEGSGSSVSSSTDSDLPAEVNLAVPFTSQAPFANWDEVHEDTCEEASVLMVHAFYEGQAHGTIDPNVAEDVLQDMVESENLIFGYFKDTTAAETARFAETYYNHERVEVLDNPSVEMLKRHLADGHPVIVPAAGRILANPFFSGIGPIYHMLVLKGYTEDGFIVNDPGTRRGADWVYEYEHLMSSIHDWVVPDEIENHPDDIPVSARKAIVIYP